MVNRYHLLAGLQVADVATTWFILANSAHHAEGNPVVAAMIGGAGLAVAMVLLLLFKLAVVAVLWRKGTGVRFVSALYGAVIVNNGLALGLLVA